VTTARRLAIPVVLALGGIALAFAGLAITLSAGGFEREFHGNSLAFFGELMVILSVGWFASLGNEQRSPRMAPAAGTLIATSGFVFGSVAFAESYSRHPNPLDKSAWQEVGVAFCLAALGWFILTRPFPARAASVVATGLGLVAVAFGLTGVVKAFGNSVHSGDWLAFAFVLAILASAARAAARPAPST
jgi:hypothetical protein